MEEVDEAVLQTISEEVLQPHRIARILELAREELRRTLEEQPSLTDTLAKRKDALEREIANLVEVAAAGTGETPAALKEALRMKETALKKVEQELVHHQALRRLTEGELREAEAFWAQVLDRLRLPQALRESTPKARQVLAKLLDGRLTFIPTEEGGRRFYTLEGRCKPVGLLKISTFSQSLHNVEGR